MNFRIAAAAVLIGMALVGCSGPPTSGSTSAHDSATSIACESFADEVRALYNNVGTYVVDEREGSGEMLREFLDRIDTIALSADDDEVKDRMFIVIANFPIAGAIMRGYGSDFEPFVEEYNAVARACDAAGASIGDYPSEFLQH